MTTSSGMKTVLAMASPLLTPSAMVISVTAHTTTMGMTSEGTKSKPTPGVSATCRKSCIRKVFGSLPQAWVKLKMVYIPAHATTAA